MQLVLPSSRYEASFIEAVEAYQKEDGIDRLDIYQLNLQYLKDNFQEYVKKLISESEGKNLPEGYVPQTTLWLIDRDEFIGRVSIRHELTEQLLKVGGHIGYDIRPSKRKMGYGKKILEMALPEAKKLGIEKVLVTCNETNIGSKKIIEENGGVLENIVEMGERKPRKLRYWIKL
jgi:predicted acetyltransferase